MDLLCVKCREPWDNDELHVRAEEEGTTYSKVAADFRSRGCEALGARCNPTGQLSPGAAAMYELLGDDMDGAAAMFEDMGADL